MSTATASSSVDLPLPFSPARKVTGLRKARLPAEKSCFISGRWDR